MHNPINRLLRATQDSGRYKRSRPHWTVEALEGAALLSFLPGTFIFLYAFVLSGAMLFASFEIEKGRYLVAIAIFVVFGTLPGLAGVVGAVTEHSFALQGFALAAIYGGIGTMGVFVAACQRRLRATCS